jgi:hypothetical protein
LPPSQPRGGEAVCLGDMLKSLNLPLQGSNPPTTSRPPDSRAS